MVLTVQKSHLPLSPSLCEIMVVPAAGHLPATEVAISHLRLFYTLIIAKSADIKSNYGSFHAISTH